MNIDKSVLQQIEKLAKLNVDQPDQEITVKKIVGILDMLDKINAKDIAEVEPLYHPSEIQQAMRDDIADSHILRDYYQENAPKTENGLFIVPKVIE